MCSDRTEWHYSITRRGYGSGIKHIHFNKPPIANIIAMDLCFGPSGIVRSRFLFFFSVPAAHIIFRKCTFFTDDRIIHTSPMDLPSSTINIRVYIYTYIYLSFIDLVLNFIFIFITSVLFYFVFSPFLRMSFKMLSSKTGVFLVLTFV